MDAVYEVAVDLHIVGTQLRPQTQARIAGAEIIQGDTETHRAVMVKRFVEQLEVVCRGLFGKFDHDLIGGDAIGLEQLECPPGLVRGIEQGLWRGVEEEFAA